MRRGCLRGERWQTQVLLDTPRLLPANGHQIRYLPKIRLFSALTDRRSFILPDVGQIMPFPGK
ncbi:hypothetical protein C2I18_21655 [Paenibacillus sp. PK3_47]|nr:hypothetical protein C2I18_21655 [Paenibacillus sp. PK3_47]